MAKRNSIPEATAKSFANFMRHPSRWIFTARFNLSQ